jgi:two-component system, OmpR family, phosphate regulon response regulator PhoB
LDAVPANILVIEHDPRLRASLAAPLQRAGYQAHCVASLAEAESALAGQETDALLIERRLPGESALSFVSLLRARPATRHLAIVVLSEGAHEDDRVLALEAGADHYLELPVSEKELAARIAALLHRRDRESREGIEIDGVPIKLPRLEYRLLSLLMSHPGRVYSREQIMKELWPERMLVERTVDVYVSRLRKALTPYGQEGRLRTVHGAGYTFLGRHNRSTLQGPPPAAAR